MKPIPNKSNFETDSTGEQSALKTATGYFSKLIDLTVWIWDRLMMYCAYFLLAPMLFLVTIANFVNVKPWARVNRQTFLYLFLAGIPLWMIIWSWLELSHSDVARKWKQRLWHGTLGIGLYLLAYGAVSFIIGKL